MEATAKNEARAGALTGKVALVAGATRGAGRAIAVELGRAGATVYATGRSSRTGRSEINRPETIEETGELISAAGGSGDRLAGGSPRKRAGARSRPAHRPRPRPPRRARERHLGWRHLPPVQHQAVGARSRRRAANAAPGHRHACDHQPPRPAAAHPSPRRAGDRDDRRYRRVQRGVPPPGGLLLRPGQKRRAADGSRAKSRIGAAPGRGHRRNSGLAALGEDARRVRRDRSELAGRDRPHAALLHLRVANLRRPRGRRPRSGPGGCALDG